MEAFTHTITLLSASGDTWETAEALVDIGATFTGVPHRCWSAWALGPNVRYNCNWPMVRLWNVP